MTKNPKSRIYERVVELCHVKFRRCRFDVTIFLVKPVVSIIRALLFRFTVKYYEESGHLYALETRSSLSENTCSGLD